MKKTQNKKIYEEAVERNILNLERLVRQGESAGLETKYAGKTIEQAKTMLGVRKVDDYWDNRILKLTKTTK